ncbi:MAG TPA: hypothetical protein VFE47_12430 [Tepidisphaeraceae bacterium]|nr:hypothetical protein [Tepidisphaeraceae bacterium]
MADLPVLALVGDLIFSTRISMAGKAAGVSVKIIRKPEKLAGEPGRLLLVDLNQDGAIDAAGAWRNGQEAVAIGFVSHVDAETARRARLAGIDRVLARSHFVKILQDLLADGTITETMTDVGGME